MSGPQIISQGQGRLGNHTLSSHADPAQKYLHLPLSFRTRRSRTPRPCLQITRLIKISNKPTTTAQCCDLVGCPVNLDIVRGGLIQRAQHFDQRCDAGSCVCGKYSHPLSCPFYDQPLLLIWVQVTSHLCLDHMERRHGMLSNC